MLQRRWSALGHPSRSSVSQATLLPHSTCSAVTVLSAHGKLTDPANDELRTHRYRTPLQNLSTPSPPPCSPLQRSFRTTTPSSSRCHRCGEGRDPHHARCRSFQERHSDRGPGRCSREGCYCHRERRRNLRHGGRKCTARDFAPRGPRHDLSKGLARDVPGVHRARKR